MLSIDALRLITVQALKGQTWAGDRVFDSPATVADLRIESERQPFCAVFVDECDTEGIDQPTATGPLNTRLIIETGVASAVTFQPATDIGAPEPPVTVTSLNDTDSALEMTIGFLAHQVRDALMSTSNPWSELWRELTGGQLRKFECVRGGPQTDAQQKPPQRYASRIQIYHTGVLATPPRGAALIPGAFWSTFLYMAAAQPELAGIGELMQAHFTYPSGNLPQWRMAEKYLGVTADVIRGIGIAPVEGYDATVVTEEPVIPLNEVNFDEPPWPLGFGWATISVVEAHDTAGI
jgi:hypothetical protein